MSRDRIDEIFVYVVEHQRRPGCPWRVVMVTVDVEQALLRAKAARTRIVTWRVGKVFDRGD